MSKVRYKYNTKTLSYEKAVTPFRTQFFRIVSFLGTASVIGVISEGLAITQLPAASAGAIFQVNKYSGKFQGEIQPTMPSGEWVDTFQPA